MTESEAAEWETEAPPTTISELKNLCTELVSLRGDKKCLEEEVEQLGFKMKSLESRILTIMKENAMPNFKGEFGTISIKNTKTISQPETLEEKLKFFEYLKEQGVFEEMVNVNSRTLSSWAAKEIESREKQGVFGWTPPGLKPAKDFQSIAVRK